MSLSRELSAGSVPPDRSPSPSSYWRLRRRSRPSRVPVRASRARARPGRVLRVPAKALNRRHALHATTHPHAPAVPNAPASWWRAGGRVAGGRARAVRRAGEREGAPELTDVDQVAPPGHRGHIAAGPVGDERDARKGVDLRARGRACWHAHCERDRRALAKKSAHQRRAVRGRENTRENTNQAFTPRRTLPPV